MAALTRRAVLAAALGLMLPGIARAAGGGASPNGEFFHKLNPINLEYWDESGLFHMVIIELSVVFLEPPQIDKKVADLIGRKLSAMPWEEFNRGNPAATVKGIALDVVRQQKGGEKATEVLVTKLMLR